MVVHRLARAACPLWARPGTGRRARRPAVLDAGGGATFAAVGGRDASGSSDADRAAAASPGTGLHLASRGVGVGGSRLQVDPRALRAAAPPAQRWIPGQWMLGPEGHVTWLDGHSAPAPLSGVIGWE